MDYSSASNLLCPGLHPAETPLCNKQMHSPGAAQSRRKYATNASSLAHASFHHLTIVSSRDSTLHQSKSSSPAPPPGLFSLTMRHSFTSRPHLQNPGPVQLASTGRFGLNLMSSPSVHETLSTLLFEKKQSRLRSPHWHPPVSIRILTARRTAAAPRLSSRHLYLSLSTTSVPHAELRPVVAPHQGIPHRAERPTPAASPSSLPL
jgi:hypothetical protein